MDAPEPNARPVASLTPTLLARKGSARPAMRSQLASLADPAGPSGETASNDDLALNDLGWNDLGEPGYVGTVVAFPHDAAPRPRSPRGSALRKGRKAAFTLRLDAERHLKLRLACTLDERSAQALVTDALDRLLAEMPELAELADSVGRRRTS